MVPTYRYPIDRPLRSRVAVEGRLDLRSVERVLRCEKVYSTTLARVIEAMTRLGLQRHIPPILAVQQKTTSK